jgi:hypothetical protein
MPMTETEDGWNATQRAAVERELRWVIERLEAIERANTGRQGMGQRANTAREARRVINRLRVILNPDLGAA